MPDDPELRAGAQAHVGRSLEPSSVAARSAADARCRPCSPGEAGQSRVDAGALVRPRKSRPCSVKSWKATSLPPPRRKETSKSREAQSGWRPPLGPPCPRGAYSRRDTGLHRCGCARPASSSHPPPNGASVFLVAPQGAPSPSAEIVARGIGILGAVQSTSQWMPTFCSLCESSSSLMGSRGGLGLRPARCVGKSAKGHRGAPRVRFDRRPSCDSSVGLEPDGYPIQARAREAGGVRRRRRRRSQRRESRRATGGASSFYAAEDRVADWPCKSSTCHSNVVIPTPWHSGSRVLFGTVGRVNTQGSLRIAAHIYIYICSVCIVCYLFLSHLTSRARRPVSHARRLRLPQPRARLFVGAPG